MDATFVTGRAGDPGINGGVPGLRAEEASRTLSRRVFHVGLALIGLQIAFRGWAAQAGFYYEDDFRYLYDAMVSGLSPDYLLQDYNGHLMPGEFLIVWLLQEVAPMSFSLVAVTLLAMQLTASLLVWALLRELVGSRPGALLPLAVYLFSPLTLGSYLWYAAALQALPLQAVLAASLLFHVRYLRRGRTVDAVLAIVVVSLGLAFWEKALLALPVLAAVTVLFFSRGGPVRRLVSALTRYWRLWLVYAALAAGYLGLYATQVAWQLRSRGGGGSTVELIREALLNGFVPALFGGPYTGFPTGLGLAPDPPIAVQLVFLQVLVLVVVATVATRPGAWKAWVLLLGYALVDCALLAAGRLDVLGPVIGRDTRYLADVSVIAAVAFALALYPLGVESPRRRRKIPAFRGALEHPVVLCLALLAYLNSSAITSLEMVDRWRETSAEGFVRTAQADLQRLGDVVVYDSAPPDEILSPWFYEDHRLSRIIGPLPERPRFDRPTSDLRVVDENGRLQKADLQVATDSGAGPEPACGWSVRSPGATTVPLDSDLFAWRWTIRVGYFTAVETSGVVTVGGRNHRVTFEQGLHSLYLVHVGEVSQVQLSVDDPAATVCVPQVAVGQL